MAQKLITNAKGVCETIYGKQFYRAAENQSDWKIFLLAQLNDDDDRMMMMMMMMMMISMTHPLQL